MILSSSLVATNTPSPHPLPPHPREEKKKQIGSAINYWIAQWMPDKVVWPGLLHCVLKQVTLVPCDGMQS